LVLVTLFCLWLGKITIEARRQKAAVAWVFSNGGSVSYDWSGWNQFPHNPLLDPPLEARPPGPDWLRNLIGDEYFQSVDTVSMRGNRRRQQFGPSPKQVSDISPLAHLSHLKRLFLGGNRIADISPLRNLKDLEAVDLSDNNISDCSPLLELHNLTHLEVQRNPLSKQQIDALYDAHRGIAMSWTAAWDEQGEPIPFREITPPQTVGQRPAHSPAALRD
jgi:hypothetical protein